MLADACKENDCSRYFDGSLEVDGMASVFLEPYVAIDQVNLRPCVDVDPSQAATKAMEATDNKGALVASHYRLGPQN